MIRKAYMTLQCVYLAVCIGAAIKFSIDLSKMTDGGTKKKKRDRKGEIVVEFID